MNVRKKILQFIIILLSVEILFYIGIRHNHTTEVQQYLNKHTEQFRIKNESIIALYGLVSSTIFNEIINQPHILRLYSKATTPDTAEQKIIRDSLLYLLSNTYNYLSTININQLQFHLPNSVSFLRFHSPERYGDTLSNIRYSIKMANELHQRYSGFESGRMYNGFRHVYPISYNNTHIGSVETSFSYKAIKEKLVQLQEEYIAFFIPQSIIAETHYSERKDNYIPSRISDKLMCEKEFLHYTDSSQFLEEIDKNIQAKVTKKIDEFSNFSVYHKYNNQYYLITFHAISNIQGKHSLYIASYKTDETIGVILRTYIISLSLGLTIIPILFIFIFLYIIEKQKIQAQNIELSKKEKHLQEAIASKNKFFSILSHDLRNPYNALLGFSDLLYNQYFSFNDEERMRYIDIIRNSVIKNLAFLETLLQWGKSQQNLTPFNPTKIDMNQTTETILAVLHNSINLKNINYSIAIPANTIIFADQNMIQTILRNLLSNAIKFTPTSGTIAISAKIEDSLFTCSIRDTGIGMDEETIQMLFSIDNTHTRIGTNGELGTGLGLLLCKDFVEKHGGNIWAESSPEQGSTFYFSIPQHKNT